MDDDRERAQEAEAERRAEARDWEPPARPDKWGRDQDWHFPRDLAPRGL